MKKGKNGQASIIIAVLLLVIILVIIVVAIVIILMNPNFINFQQKEQSPIVIIKTIQETPTQPTCMYPYRQIGNTCCIDNDGNGICDSDEIKKQSIPSCSRPYIRDGTSCCLDDNDNNLCDMYEHHYARYYDDKYDSRYFRYDSRYDNRNNPRNCFYYPKTNSSEKYYRCDW
jgi:hypothetical protein